MNGNWRMNNWTTRLTVCEMLLDENNRTVFGKEMLRKEKNIQMYKPYNYTGRKCVKRRQSCIFVVCVLKIVALS